MSIKVYSTWKTGSTFLRRYFTEIASALNLKVIKLTASRFHSNPKQAELSTNIQSNNYCAILYRFFPDHTTLKNKTIQHIIQIRDPRDVLVSLYYSMAFSHPYGSQKVNEIMHKKTQSIPIDKFVIDNMHYFYRIYNDLKISTEYNNVKYMFYDDMVLNFKEYNHQLSLLLKINEQDFFDKFISEFNIVEENVNNHKRIMLPGDYKKKLNKQTISALNDKFYNINILINSLKSKNYSL